MAGINTVIISMGLLSLGIDSALIFRIMVLIFKNSFLGDSALGDW